MTALNATPGVQGTFYFTVKAAYKNTEDTPPHVPVLSAPYTEFKFTPKGPNAAQPSSPLNLHSIGPIPPLGGHVDYQIVTDTMPFQYAGLGTVSPQSVSFYLAAPGTPFTLADLNNGTYTYVGEAANSTVGDDSGAILAEDEWAVNIPHDDLNGGSDQLVFAVATSTTTSGTIHFEIAYIREHSSPTRRRSQTIPAQRVISPAMP